MKHYFTHQSRRVDSHFQDVKTGGQAQLIGSKPATHRN